MKKTKYIVLFTICMFAFPLISNAECSYERQAELSRMANNVKFSYNYEIQNGAPIFTVNITNVTNDIYIQDATFDNIIRQPAEIKYNQDGENIQYEIFSNDDNCKDEKIITKYLELPSYNEYSNYPICKENPNVPVCQMWTDTTSYNIEQISTSINQYNNQSNVKEKKEDKTIWDIFKENAQTLEIIGIVILLLIGLLVLKKVKK